MRERYSTFFVSLRVVAEPSAASSLHLRNYKKVEGSARH